MAGATTTTLTSAINKIYPALVTETKNSVKTPLRDLLPKVPKLGGASYDWIVRYAGNTSSVAYSEGDAVSAAGYQTYAACTLAASSGYLRTMVQITGHAMDAMKGAHFDGVADELAKGIEDHLHAKEGLVVTALEAAIDSGGSYAGQTRSTALLASYEVAGTPTLAELQLMYQTLLDNEPAANVAQSVILMAPDTMFDYLDVATGVAYFEFDSTMTGVVDAGKLIGGKYPTYNGRPIVPVPGLTSGITLLLTPEAGAKLVTFRDIQVDVMGKTDDSNVVSITSSEICVVESPRKAGKIT